MTKDKTVEVIDKIFKSVFGKSLDIDLNDILEKFAFDVELPKKVNDSITGEETWADSITSDKFITLSNMEKRDTTEGWMLTRQAFESLEDIINIWNKTNYTTTERVYDSVDVSCSDTIYRCEGVYRSSDCGNSKRIVYCSSCHQSEYLLASKRSTSLNFCIRTDDSQNCSNSYSVVCSNKISNSLFIQDCFNLHECIFCSHIANKRFCIANMQFEEDEYYEIKKAIVDWILSS